MESSISFVLDGRVVTVDLAASPHVTPTTTVLQYLRNLPHHTGVKEGCAEGDCGACTVVLADLTPQRMLRYRSVDSCLLFLPMIHGKQLITVENLRSADGTLHAVQQAMVDLHGSQCGFCTPGVVMSLFALYKRTIAPSREDAEEALSGNLCRCTGYRPIVDAALKACSGNGRDHLSNAEPETIALLSRIPRRTLVLQTDRHLYLRPATLSEAKSFRVQYPHAVLISGATDAALRVTKKHEHLAQIIDCSDVDELRSASATDGALRLGAGMSIADAAQHAAERFPALTEMLRWFGSPQIRGVATLGGSLGTASPIGDVLPVLIAYDARIILEGLKSRREVPAAEFVTGYRRTVRHDDELITSVIIPSCPQRTVVRSYKVSKRRDLDIATVSAGFRLERSDAGLVSRAVLAYGGMAERTKRAETVERFLTGKPWTRAVVEEAMTRVGDDLTPISDARASAEGRSVIAQNLLLKFWLDSKRNGDS